VSDNGSDDASLANVAKVIDHIARSLVDESDEVDVSVDLTHDKPRINVSAADGEIGRLIGKRGRTATAIRAVGRAAAARDGVDVDIEFLD
jgi:predicted RNA-binding protein YlqC (UPF0109 family)